MASRERRVSFSILLCGLLLLTAAERRLAELDFNAPGVLQIENGERPEGDEIFNRLVYVDDAAEPRAPQVRDSVYATLASLETRPLALVFVRLSEPRAPPRSVPT